MRIDRRVPDPVRGDGGGARHPAVYARVESRAVRVARRHRRLQDLAALEGPRLRDGAHLLVRAPLIARTRSEHNAYTHTHIELSYDIT